jgi:hypothetical protein
LARLKHGTISRGPDLNVQLGQSIQSIGRNNLRWEDIVDAASKISSIQGARSAGELTVREIRCTVQDFLDIVPAEIADTMPKVEIDLVERLTRIVKRGGKEIIEPATEVFGDYVPAALGGPRIRLSVAALRGSRAKPATGPCGATSPTNLPTGSTPTQPTGKPPLTAPPSAGIIMTAPLSISRSRTARTDSTATTNGGAVT